MTSTDAYATFYVADFYFGIPSAAVVELTSATSITPVPLAPPAVSGLINLRGQIVTAIDVRRRFGIAPRAGCQNTITVFVALGGNMFGLVIDRISDILELDAQHFDKSPSYLPAVAADLIIGFHKLPDKLMFVLNVDRLIYGCLD
jgi:purine-binding chemotaxis protein CheW